MRGTVEALEVFDDHSGQGRALFLGGAFSGAGTEPTRNLARWHGDRWSSLPTTPDARVRAIAAFDDGINAGLVVAGDFTTVGGVPLAHVARWNGTSWSALGAGLLGSVRALAVHDDGGGAGPRLYAAASISSGPTVSSVALWDGAQWQPVGMIASGTATHLAVVDDGGGARLYAAGTFSLASGTARVVEWDGVSWQDTGLTGTVAALGVFDEGTGEHLFASSFAGTGAVQRYAAGAWSVTAPFSTAPTSLGTFDDGTGRALYAGFPSSSTTTPALRRWNGTSWSDVPGTDGINNPIAVLKEFRATPTAPAELYLGGSFTSIGPLGAEGIARWAPNLLDVLGMGAGGAEGVLALDVFDDGNGARLFASGISVRPAAFSSRYVAAFDGRDWQDTGPNSATAYEPTCSIVHHDASGPRLWVGGDTPVSAVMAWDGANWSLAAGQVNGSVFALGSYDDGTGSGLYAAGNLFVGIQHFDIARWNGTAWSGLGAGAAGVLVMTAFDDGAGSKLYVGGDFFAVDGGTVTAPGIACWNGTTWSAVGPTSSVTGLVRAFEAFDDGSGSALYVAGDFTAIGGIPAQRIARWNGTSWSAVGGGADGSVRDLAVFDDGTGAALYASGAFTQMGGNVALGIARWNGSAWSEVEGGLTDPLSPFPVGERLAVYDDGRGFGPALYVSGRFHRAGGKACTGFARFGCEPGVVESFCAGDGIGPSPTTACPCGNTGGSGRGCASSVSPIGAQLAFLGEAAADTLVLTGSGMPSTAACIYLQGDASADTTFGDGVRCTGGLLLRLRTKVNAAGTSRFPDSTDTVTLSTRGGVTPGSGTVRLYQTYYRNAAAAFCPPETFNVTNGLRVTW